MPFPDSDDFAGATGERPAIAPDDAFAELEKAAPQKPKREPFAPSTAADRSIDAKRPPVERALPPAFKRAPSQAGAAFKAGGDSGPRKAVDAEKGPAGERAAARKDFSYRDVAATIVFVALAFAIYYLQVAPAGADHLSAAAFDDLAYSKSFALGKGLTWFGERTGAHHDLLWALLNGASGMLFGGIADMAQRLGMLFGGLTFALLLFLSHDLFGRWWPGALAALLLSIHFPFAAWAASGADDAFFSFAYTFALWTFAREIKSGDLLLSGLAWGALAFTRPDAAWFAAAPALSVFLLLLAGGGVARTRSLAWLAGFAATLAALGWANLELGDRVFLGTMPAWRPEALLDSAAWSGFALFYERYTELCVVVLVASAITLERGPERLGPAFLAFYVALAGGLVAVAAIGKAPGALHRDLAPFLPAFCFAAASGLAMLFYHRPEGSATLAFYLLVVGAIVGALGFSAASTSMERADDAARSLAAKESLEPLRRWGAARAEERMARKESATPPRLASSMAAAAAFYAEAPVLDLAGRHRVAALGRRAATPSDLLAWNPDLVHLPMSVLDGDGATPVGGEWSGSARLYFDESFQRAYRRVERGGVAFFERAPNNDAPTFMPNFAKARLEAVAPSQARVGGVVSVAILFANEGEATYAGERADEPGRVALVARWLPRRGVSPPGAGLDFAIPLPHALPPGATASFERLIDVPGEPGRWTLEIEPVLVGRGAFRDLGGPGPVELAIEAKASLAPLPLPVPTAAPTPEPVASPAPATTPATAPATAPAAAPAPKPSPEPPPPAPLETPVASGGAATPQ